MSRLFLISPETSSVPSLYPHSLFGFSGALNTVFALHLITLTVTSDSHVGLTFCTHVNNKKPARSHAATLLIRTTTVSDTKSDPEA